MRAPPVAEPSAVDRQQDARRRANRARAAARVASADPSAPTADSRVDYSIERINALPQIDITPRTTAASTDATPTAAGPDAQQGSTAQSPDNQAPGDQALGDQTGGEQLATDEVTTDGAPEPAPAPEPGITAEEVAARAEQVASAQAALDDAQSADGVMAAFAAAPPTVKAQVSGELGERLSTKMQAESRQLQESTPPVEAKMTPNAPPPAGAIPEPVSITVELEPGSVPPAPAAEAVVGESVANDTDANRNADVTQQLRRAYSADSGAGNVNQALDNVQTTDPDLNTSPGSPPPVPQSGETDPARFQNQSGEGSRRAQETAAQQRTATTTLPGAERVQLANVDETHRIEDVPTPTADSAPAPEGAQQYLQMAMPADVQTAFDGVAGEPMRASMADAQTQITQATTDRDQAHQTEVAQAHRDTAAAQRQADRDQGTKVADARRQIEGERATTLTAQQDAVRDVEGQATDRRRTDQESFDNRVRDDQHKLDDRYAKAETDTATEVRAGERRAETKRAQAERESEDQSWWEAALDFITDLFDALVSAINAIFDAVRAAVNAILDAVRDFAIALIELAASALKGLIEAFGTFLKGLVENLLGDIFPGLARALTAFIDRAVDAATAAIDTVANALVSAVNAIVETLRAGINALINTFQAAVNTALALARAALTGDWGAFLTQLLEAACRVAGIDVAQVYAFIGRAQETIQLIIDNPGQFLANVLDALLGGFRRFADNFLTHLQAGIIGWLTGSLGSAGITLPQRFDLMGVISLVAQILGLTWQNIRPRLVRVVGERGVEAIEFVAGYVQTLIEGGFSALWEQIQQDLASLRDMVLEQIREFLVTRIIMAAVTRLATMFNPVGALVNILIAAYNFFTFIRDQLQRIMQLVTTVVEAISNIAHGVLGPAQQSIENFLASLLPLALDLLARLIGLGNVGQRVGQILRNFQQRLWTAIERLAQRVLARFRGGGGRERGGAEDGHSSDVRQRATQALMSQLREDHNYNEVVQIAQQVEGQYRPQGLVRIVVAQPNAQDEFSISIEASALTPAVMLRLARRGYSVRMTARIDFAAPQALETQRRFQPSGVRSPGVPGQYVQTANIGTHGVIASETPGPQHQTSLAAPTTIIADRVHVTTYNRGNRDTSRDTNESHAEEAFISWFRSDVSRASRAQLTGIHIDISRSPCTFCSEDLCRFMNEIKRDIPNQAQFTSTLTYRSPHTGDNATTVEDISALQGCFTTVIASGTAVTLTRAEAGRSSRFAIDPNWRR